MIIITLFPLGCEKVHFILDLRLNKDRKMGCVQYTRKIIAFGSLNYVKMAFGALKKKKIELSQNGWDTFVYI